MKLFLVKHSNKALEEANDINTYLKPLRPQIEKLLGVSEFTELVHIFPGIFHTLLMIWKSSKHYCTTNRLAIILQEICNEILETARTYISPSELFTSDPDEASARLKTVSSVIEAFKSTFFSCKESTLLSPRPWSFDTKLVFSRLDTFFLRINQILELFDIIVEFNRLEKIEIGGAKGKILSSQITQIFAEFTGALSTFARIKYDVLNIASDEFDKDRTAFLSKISDLDRRIGYK
jgi:dynein heavy chain